MGFSVVFPKLKFIIPTAGNSLICDKVICTPLKIIVNYDDDSFLPNGSNFNNNKNQQRGVKSHWVGARDYEADHENIGPMTWTYERLTPKKSSQ